MWDMQIDKKEIVMKVRWLIVAIGALALLGAEKPKPELKKDLVHQEDLRKMQGDWVVVEGEQGGKSIGADDLKSMHFHVGSDQYEFKQTGATEKGTLSVDASQRPKALDIHIVEGDQAGKLQRGIYQFDGGRLKICVSPPGDDRPKEFKTKENKEDAVLIFERPKKD
jgi:uncharacterized protein (TIGR03067 family)